MASFVKYGSYSFGVGSAAPIISSQALFSAADTPYAKRVNWNIEGLLVGSSDTDINSQIQALEAALSIPNQDAVLYLADGTTPSHHQILNANTIGGVRIQVYPSYPTGRDSELVTKRIFNVQIEADIPLTGSDLASGFLSFTETVSISGGGPKIGFHQPVIGLPLAQTLRLNTVFTATQSGTVVGLYGYPVFPGPLFAGALVQAPEIKKTSPERRGSGFAQTYIAFSIEYTYNFASATNLAADPNLWA